LPPAADSKGVSDLSLLAIAEAKMNPGPRELLFKGCYDVTDTGVSWIAERCPSIVCLNVLVGAGRLPRRLLRWLSGVMDRPLTAPLWMWVCGVVPGLLQGCSVSRPGLRAMLHAWSHVRLRDDAEWLGPAPAERAHELKFIEEFGEQWKAAAKIQVGT
jgi:hypothetical protein